MIFISGYEYRLLLIILGVPWWPKVGQKSARIMPHCIGSNRDVWKKNFAPLDGEGDFHIEDLCGDLSKVSTIQVRCSLQGLSSEHSTQKIRISGEGGKVCIWSPLKDISLHKEHLKVQKWDGHHLCNILRKFKFTVSFHKLRKK